MKLLLISISLITSIVSSVGYLTIKEKSRVPSNPTYTITRYEIKKDTLETYSEDKVIETVADGYRAEVFPKLLQVYPGAKKTR
ncbi:MAG: hypothetical protein OEZ20_01380 [candidate division WOR-3 bacterium]|nr:hypothetical protein [candidate division WOR-3 bacterium]MDH5683108.1 hypothetical protein [candidate division WOR-3 bacterium]